jgi:hypothetical protein
VQRAGPHGGSDRSDSCQRFVAPARHALFQAIGVCSIGLLDLTRFVLPRPSIVAGRDEFTCTQPIVGVPLIRGPLWLERLSMTTMSPGL